MRNTPQGEDALAAWLAGRADPAQVKAAVRFTLAQLVAAAPGGAVEIRVPPVAVVQAVAGLRHTRGTPPNTVEMDARTWLELATGQLDWGTAVASGRVQASGTRADLSAYLPVVERASG